jgi:hypothetical protein
LCPLLSSPNNFSSIGFFHKTTTVPSCSQIPCFIPLLLKSQTELITLIP